jgi:RNA polymerase sigma-70 factor (ECF subfamily)
MPQRTNEEWLAALRSPGVEQEAALGDLHAILLKGLPYALSTWLPPDSPQFSALSEEVAQETLLRVLDRLDTFEGRSQFTTWAHKIAVRLALTELRRKRWEEVSLDDLLEGDETPPPSRLESGSEPSPEDYVEGGDLIGRVRRIIAEELTDKQRRALVAIAIQGMPVDEVARRLGTNRNALYKLLHDARLRLRRRLEEQGLTPSEVLSVFERV